MDVQDVRAATDKATEQIERALEELSDQLGPGWKLGLDVHWVDVMTFEAGGARFIPRVTVSATLLGGLP